MSDIEDSGWYQTADGYERTIELYGVTLELSAPDEATQDEIVGEMIASLSMRAAR